MGISVYNNDMLKDEETQEIIPIKIPMDFVKTARLQYPVFGLFMHMWATDMRNYENYWKRMDDATRAMIILEEREMFAEVRRTGQLP